MVLSLFGLMEACVLVLNALAVLNPHYFLEKCTLYADNLHDVATAGDYQAGSMRKQATLLLYSVRTYLRPPLVIFNLLLILVEMLLG
jgi:hypothetical protein